MSWATFVSLPSNTVTTSSNSRASKHSQPHLFFASRQQDATPTSRRYHICHHEGRHTYRQMGTRPFVQKDKAERRKQRKLISPHKTTREHRLKSTQATHHNRRSRCHHKYKHLQKQQSELVTCRSSENGWHTVNLWPAGYTCFQPWPLCFSWCLYRVNTLRELPKLLPQNTAKEVHLVSILNDYLHAEYTHNTYIPKH